MLAVDERGRNEGVELVGEGSEVPEVLTLELCLERQGGNRYSNDADEGLMFSERN